MFIILKITLIQKIIFRLPKLHCKFQIQESIFLPQQSLCITIQHKEGGINWFPPGSCSNSTTQVHCWFNLQSAYPNKSQLKQVLHSKICAPLRQPKSQQSISVVPNCIGFQLLHRQAAPGWSAARRWDPIWHLRSCATTDRLAAGLAKVAIWCCSHHARARIFTWSLSRIEPTSCAARR